MNNLTTWKLVAKIAALIAIVELFIMLLLGYVPHEMDDGGLLFSHMILLAVLDVILLVIFTSPLIYVWVVKPFIQERDAALAKMASLAHYDALTNLANRRLINQNLKTLQANCIRSEKHGALVMIDLDKFKPINDTYGHDAGDAVLVETAKRLISAVRDADVVGRIGGDEFVILIDCLGDNKQTATEKAVQFAEKLHAIINQPMDCSGETLLVGSSIGIALLDSDKITIDTAFKRADVAMYKAKNSNEKHVVYS